MPSIEKLTPDTQPELPSIDEERQRIISRIEELGSLAVSELVELYESDKFTFADIKSFAAENGRNTSEAGKIFSSFYRGIENLDVEPPRNRAPLKYQHNRDEFSYSLTLLSNVLKNRDPNEEDLYSGLLRKFHNERIEGWFEKQSTSA